MKESFKLSKLKHDLRHIKQSPDETHSMYLERFQKLEAQIKTEQSELRVNQEYEEMVLTREEREFKQAIVKTFGAVLGSALICLILFLLFQSC
jgi:hypothetical protein